jgi:hypothetical protein
MTKLQAVTLSLLFIAGLATPSIVTRRIPWPRAAHSAALDPGTAAVGENPARPRAEGPNFEVVTAVPEPSAALAALRQWLEQADGSPFLASAHEDKLRQLVRALGAEDFPRAWALKVKSHALQEKFENILLARWAAADPQAALSAAQTVSERSTRRGLLDTAVCAWAGKEPAAAAAWVKSFYPEAEQASKLMLVFYACGTQQPHAARALWQQMPAGVARDEAATTFIESLAHQDLEAAIACLDDIKSSNIRRRAREDILLQRARTDPAATLAWAQEQPRLQDRDEATLAVIAGLREQNPSQAAEVLKSLSASAIENAEGAIGAVLTEWVAKDLAAATTWVMQLPEGTLREHALEELMPRWVAQDPHAAVTFAQTLADGAAQSKLLTLVAYQWAMRDSKAAQSWLEALPEGTARNAVVSGFSDGLACRKPQEAAAFVAALPPGDLQADVALTVVGHWASDDPASAAAWVAAFPPGKTREQAVAKLMKEWRTSDRPAAEAWRRETGAESKEKLP